MMMKYVFFLLKCLAQLPHSWLRALANALGWACYYLVKPRTRVGLANLAACFPDKSAHERKALLKAHYRHMALLVLEYGRYWYCAPETLQAAVDYQDKHYLDEALARGEKVILLYPHFTAFEAALYALNQNTPLISVYSHQKNKDLDTQILKGRHRYHNVYLIGRTEGLRSIIKRIKTTNAPFLYLPDQDFGAKDSVFVPFFNIPTATITGLSRISALTHAKIIPAIPTRHENGRVTLRFYAPWQNFPSTDPIADAMRMNQFIEARVREQPEQYFWLHKRFKTRPQGEPPFYG